MIGLITFQESIRGPRFLRHSHFAPVQTLMVPRHGKVAELATVATCIQFGAEDVIVFLAHGTD